MINPDTSDKNDKGRDRRVNAKEHLKALHEMSLKYRRPVSQDEISTIVNSLKDKAFVVPKDNERIILHQSGSYDFNIEAFTHSESWAPYGRAAVRIQARCGDKVLENFDLPLHLINVETQEKLSFRNQGAGRFDILGLTEGHTYQIKLSNVPNV